MKRKVVFIGGNLRINGISTQMMIIIRSLHEKYNFIIINTALGHGYYRDEVKSLDCKVYDVIVPECDARLDIQSKEIRAILAYEKPEVIHSNYYTSNGVFLKQAFLENVPIRIAHCNQAYPTMDSKKKSIVEESRKLTNEYATHLIACSESAREFAYGSGGFTVLGAIDYENYGERSSDSRDYSLFGLNPEMKYVLFVGRMAHQKNLPFILDLVSAFNDATNISFILVGSGSERILVDRYIDLHKPSNLLVFDKVDDLGMLMDLASCLILPSLYEGLALVLIEAQAVGLRCLAADSITHESQIGLVSFLPLDLGIWKEKIEVIIGCDCPHEPKYDRRFDKKYATSLFDGIYEGLSSDDWISRGKEYTLGSKRFLRDKDMSFDCFKMAHNLGNIRGTFYYALGIFEGNGAVKDQSVAQDIVSAVVTQMEQLAEDDSPEHLVILGDMYSFGLGKKQDFTMAAPIYHHAASLGSLEAMCDLGYMYSVGQGVPKDLKRSFEMYKNSADSGYLHSMRDVGQCYFFGTGTDLDYAKSIHYFQMASDNSYSHGTTDLAYCYLNGYGVATDFEQAKTLYNLAMKQDPDRTFRDLISNDIDVKEFLTNNCLIIRSIKEIKEIGIQNEHEGTLCVSSRIDYVDPGCFYESDIHKIFVEKDNPHYAVKNGVLFDKKIKKLIRYPPMNPESAYTLPDTVEEIGPMAFQNSRNLLSIILNEGLTVIDDSAFDDCKLLKNISIPASVRCIGDWAFHACDSISEFKISKDLMSLGKYAFGSCESLCRIAVDPDNASFASCDGNLYDKSFSTLLQYSIGKADLEFILPTTVTKIAFRALSDAYHLKFVDCSHVDVIDEKGLYYDIRLEKVRVKNTVVIGECAFYHVAPNFEMDVIE